MGGKENVQPRLWPWDVHWATKHCVFPWQCRHMAEQAQQGNLRGLRADAVAGAAEVCGLRKTGVGTLGIAVDTQSWSVKS